MTVITRTSKDTGGCGCGSGGCCGNCGGACGDACGAGGSALCPQGAIARPRFFGGQLLTQTVQVGEQVVRGLLPGRTFVAELGRCILERAPGGNRQAW